MKSGQVADDCRPLQVVLGAQWVAGRSDKVLSNAARDVVAKIAAVVPEHLRPFILEPSVGAKPPIEEPEESSDTSKLRSAIRNGLKLRLRYRSEAGEETVPPGLLMSLGALTGTGVALGLMAGRTRGVGGTG